MSDIHTIACPWCEHEFEIDASEHFDDGSKSDCECPKCECALSIEAEYDICNIYVSSWECEQNKKDHRWGEWHNLSYLGLAVRDCLNCGKHDTKDLEEEAK